MRMLLVAAGIAVTTVACGTQPTAEPDLSGQRQLAPRYGVSVSLPDGWHGGLTRGALVEATFPVPSAGSIGLREMAFPQLEGADARVLLFEAARENRSPPTDSSEYPPLERELRFEAAAFGADDGNSDDSRLTGHGFARKTFQVSGRLFVVFVETGSLPMDNPGRAHRVAEWLLTPSRGTSPRALR